MFKRNIWVHPFHEDDPMDVVRLIGADRVLFGSDYPHPEGLAEPTSYVDQLAELPHDDIARIMGGNLAEVMGFAGMSLEYDPYSQEVGRDPHALFRRMRDEAPLYYNEELDFYALSRFDDVERGPRRPGDVHLQARGDARACSRPTSSSRPGTVIFEDPPIHTIHRSLLSRMFTPRKVSGLEPKIRELCAELLDPLVGTGRFDFAGRPRRGHADPGRRHAHRHPRRGQRSRARPLRRVPPRRG